jgi:hypothetical protein
MKKKTFRNCAAIACPHAGTVYRACMTNVPSLPLMSTTCVGRSLVPTLPISLTKPQGLVLGHFGSWETLCSDSHIRSYMGPVVSRAAVPQGIQFRRLRALWAVVVT